MIVIKILIQINVNSLNIVKTYYVNNFSDSFQTDACNNNTDQETSGDNYDSMNEWWIKMNGYKSSINGESLYLFLS